VVFVREKQTHKGNLIKSCGLRGGTIPLWSDRSDIQGGAESGSIAGDYVNRLTPRGPLGFKTQPGSFRSGKQSRGTEANGIKWWWANGVFLESVWRRNKHTVLQRGEVWLASRAIECQAR